MINTIYFGDNLPILQNLPSESVDLIYIDPPFNTGKTQKHKTIQTVRSSNGDRKGFMGEKYSTIEIGTKSYEDSFDNELLTDIDESIIKAYEMLSPEGSIYYLERFLLPRLYQAYRILKKHGSLYFHIDYREVSHCKLLLDRVFGKNSYLNEIIWAYDFGGRSKSRWPAKHDNILLYVKDPKNYIFNTNEIDREEYMAPGLVGPDKVKKGKLPTDTWFYPYVGKKVTDTWWNTIVGTNSKEKTGYPSQKPRKIIERIIRASSLPGNTVMDFFAGSGTVGICCAELKRNFILIDNNILAMEVMAKSPHLRENVSWINFDPSKLKISEKSTVYAKFSKSVQENEGGSDFQDLVIASSHLQRELEETSEFWKDSPFEWILQLPSRKKGKFARELVQTWLSQEKYKITKAPGVGESLCIGEKTFSIKFSTLWTSNIYRFQQIRSDGYDYLICLGISPHTAHCWIIDKESALKNSTVQHKGTNNAEFWLEIDPYKQGVWYEKFGGYLGKAKTILRKIISRDF